MESANEYLSLAQITKAVPAIDGKRPHVSTVWRWMHDGIRGVHLEHMRVGRRIVTTREALDRFFRDTADAPLPERKRHTPITGRTEKQRQRDLAKAKASLAARKGAV